MSCNTRAPEQTPALPGDQKRVPSFLREGGEATPEATCAVALAIISTIREACPLTPIGVHLHGQAWQSVPLWLQKSFGYGTEGQHVEFH